MEANDTVMSKEEILTRAIDMGLMGLFTHDAATKALTEHLEHQAEISFPLGKAEGRKEVVEWFKTKQGAAFAMAYYGKTSAARTFQVDEDEWQAKLKEWGVEQSQTLSTSPKE